MNKGKVKVYIIFFIFFACIIFHSETVVIRPIAKSIKYILRNVSNTDDKITLVSILLILATMKAPIFTIIPAILKKTAGIVDIHISKQEKPILPQEKPDFLKIPLIILAPYFLNT
jgi:hypothetical protein